MIRGWAASRSLRRLVVVAAVASVVAATALVVTLDFSELAGGVRRGLRDPLGLLLIAAALLAAFTMRAYAWSRLLPRLSLGQSLAALHLSLGANHVLPFRLGEPLRIASVVRRTPIELGPATTTTVLLRAADFVTLLAIGAMVAPGLVSDRLNTAAILVLAAIALAGVVALLAVVHQRSKENGSHRTRLPDAGTLLLVVAAWVAEAVVVWRVAQWFGIQLDARGALAVLAAAVTIQAVAITPGGVGTYEAAGTAALIALDVPLATALAMMVVLHGVKTVYSLVTGVVAVVTPQPSMLGRLRLPNRPAEELRTEASSTPGSSSALSTTARTDGPATVADVRDRRPAQISDGPIVLILPAHNEAPRIESVIRSVPAAIDGHQVEVVVVDDGSKDATAAIARGAGASVLSHDGNRGLGAAVRTGFAHASSLGARAAAFCDADGEYDPLELHRLVRPILSGDADYVVGSRFGGEIRRMLPHRRVGNLVLTRWVRFIARVPITDGQSGYRALSARALADVEIAHDYNYAQVLTIDLVAKGHGYHEVPITYAFRRSGRSFVRLGTYLRHVVPTVWHQLNPPTQKRMPDSPKELSPCPSTPGLALSPSRSA